MRVEALEVLTLGRGLRRLRVLGVFVVVVACFLPFCAESSELKQSSQISIVSLSDWCGSPCAAGATVQFVGPDTLALSFQRENPRVGVNQPRPVHSGPLVALFLDTGTGRLKGRMEWPAERGMPPPPIPVLLTVADGFIVQVGSHLWHYSIDLQLLHELKIDEDADTWRLQVSPSGGIALIRTGKWNRAMPKPEYHEMWLRLSDFHQVYSGDARAPASEIGVMSDSGYVVTHMIREMPPPQSESFVLELSGEKLRLSTLGPMQATLAFLSENVLLTADAHGFSVIKTQGDVLLRGKMTFGFKEWPHVSHSRDGNRFAILDFRAPTISPMYKTQPVGRDYTAKVYDIEERRELGEVRLGIHDARMVSMALAPDGSALAVFSTDSIRVFKLSQ